MLSKKQRKITKEACEKHQNLSNEEKINRQYGCERYECLSEAEKEKLGEYRKKYYRMLT